MMKLHHLITCTILSILLFGCSEQQSSKNESNTQKTTTSQNNSNWETYIVGSELPYPPFEFPDENGRPIGFEIDLLNEIGKAAQFNVQFINARRSELPNLLNEGRFQIIASAYATEEGDILNLSASKPFLDFQTQAFILDNDDNKHIQSGKDLQGLNISVNRGSTNYNKLAEKITGNSDNIVPADSFYLSLRNVYTENATAALGDVSVLRYHSLKAPMKTRLVPLEDTPVGQLVFLVKKDDQEILNKIDTGLKIVKENGTYEQLTQKWFGY